MIPARQYRNLNSAVSRALLLLCLWAFPAPPGRAQALIPEELQGQILLADSFYKSSRQNDAQKIIESLQIAARELRDRKARAMILYKLGGLCFSADELHRSRELFNSCVKLLLSLPDADYELANAYNKLGNLEESAGNYSAALNNFLQYLRLAEKLNSQRDIAIACNNIAIVYSDLGEYKKELTYNIRALKIREQLKDPAELSASYNNLGVSYQSLENHESARHYFVMSLRIRSETKDLIGVAACYHNLAISAKQQGRFPEAESYYLRALHIQDSLGGKTEAALTRINIGRLMLETKRYSQGIKHLRAALATAEQSGSMSLRADAHEALHELNEAAGNFEQTFYHFRKFVELRDSLNNLEQSREFARVEMQHKFDREMEHQRAEQARKRAEEEHEKFKSRILLGSVSGIALLTLAFSAFIFRSYQHKKSANELITAQKQKVESQKKVIEEKQKEIIDSINYAKRIQSAILAAEKDIRALLPQSFLFYRPKDIVAGDFYFFEKTEDFIFYAAADCTGHGVPGALVSVVCANALNRCVNEFGMTDPGELLEKTRELVVETFRKSADNVKDGMDISLLVIPRQREHYPFEVLWAGANNPLWYCTGTGGTWSFTEIKADKQAIGLTEQPSPFSTRRVAVTGPTLFYLFTDGLADQFGGPRGKKFKYRQMQELFLSCCGDAPETQRETIKSAFEDWSLGQEQVDDILITAIKI